MKYHFGRKVLHYSGLISLATLLIISLWSCSDDDYKYPSVVSEFADVYTNTDGKLDYLITDNNLKLSISNTVSADGLVPDSAYRVICTYQQNEENDKEARLYSISLINAPYAIPAFLVEEKKNDPVEVQSIWRGGNYLNLILLLKAQNIPHSFLFLQDSIVSVNERTNLYISLYHDKEGDLEAYTQKAYLSMPLQPYQRLLKEGDTICLSINTYDKGVQTWKRLY